MQFGDKQIFAFSVGGYWGGSNQLREVDIWAASRRLTCFDNCAYLPSFIYSLECELNWLSRDDTVSDFNPADYGGNAELLHQICKESEIWDRHWFLNHGETTDDVISYIFRSTLNFLITFEFCQETNPSPIETGQVFSVEIPEHDLLSSLRQTVNYLRSDTIG